MYTLAIRKLLLIQAHFLTTELPMYGIEDKMGKIKKTKRKKKPPDIIPWTCELRFQDVSSFSVFALAM